MVFFENWKGSAVDIYVDELRNAIKVFSQKSLWLLDRATSGREFIIRKKATLDRLKNHAQTIFYNAKREAVDLLEQGLVLPLQKSVATVESVGLVEVLIHQPELVLGETRAPKEAGAAGGKKSAKSKGIKPPKVVTQEDSGEGSGSLRFVSSELERLMEVVAAADRQLRIGLEAEPSTDGSPPEAEERLAALVVSVDMPGPGGEDGQTMTTSTEAGTSSAERKKKKKKQKGDLVPDCTTTGGGATGPVAPPPGVQSPSKTARKQKTTPSSASDVGVGPTPTADVELLIKTGNRIEDLLQSALRCPKTGAPPNLLAPLLAPAVIEPSSYALSSKNKITKEVTLFEASRLNPSDLQELLKEVFAQKFEEILDRHDGPLAVNSKKAEKISSHADHVLSVKAYGQGLAVIMSTLLRVLLKNRVELLKKVLGVLPDVVAVVRKVQEAGSVAAEHCRRAMLGNAGAAEFGAIGASAGRDPVGENHAERTTTTTSSGGGKKKKRAGAVGGPPGSTSEQTSSPKFLGTTTSEERKAPAQSLESPIPESCRLLSNGLSFVDDSSGRVRWNPHLRGLLDGLEKLTIVAERLWVDLSPTLGVLSDLLQHQVPVWKAKMEDLQQILSDRVFGFPESLQEEQGTMHDHLLKDLQEEQGTMHEKEGTTNGGTTLGRYWDGNGPIFVFC